MSHKANERMFWFRGSTMAVGGRIESPVCENIDAQGACVLPPIGGFAAASVDGFNYKNIIAFERATSTVSGQKTTHDGKTAGETLVTVAIEGLNVLDVITADRVVARMTSRHVKDEKQPRSQPEILPFGSCFENLRIGGVPIDLRPYPELVCEGRHEGLLKACAQSPGQSERFRWIDSNGTPLLTDQAPPKNKKGLQYSEPGADRAHLAPLFKVGKGNAAAPTGSAMSGEHGIRIPGFGVVYFGEYLITRASRRLTMIRIELGCPISGSIVCAHVDSNGHWDP
jgi:hypothetical protein